MPSLDPFGLGRGHYAPLLGQSRAGLLCGNRVSSYATRAFLMQNTWLAEYDTDQKRAIVVAAVAALIILIGSMLPWVTLGPISIAGTSGDGKITLAIAIIVLLAIGILFNSTGDRHIKPISTLILLLGIVTVVMSIYKIVDIESAISDKLYLSGLVSVGIGLYMVLNRRASSNSMCGIQCEQMRQRQQGITRRGS